MEDAENQPAPTAESKGTNGDDGEKGDQAVEDDGDNKGKKVKKGKKRGAKKGDVAYAAAADGEVAPGKNDGDAATSGPSEGKEKGEPSYLDDTTNLNGFVEKSDDVPPPLDSLMEEFDDTPLDQLDPDERKRREYLTMLRAKRIKEDPDAYNRSRIKVIPQVPRLTTRPQEVVLPTKAEIADSLRDTLRSSWSQNSSGCHGCH